MMSTICLVCANTMAFGFSLSSTRHRAQILFFRPMAKYICLVFGRMRSSSLTDTVAGRCICLSPMLRISGRMVAENSIVCLFFGTLDRM